MHLIGKENPVMSSLTIPSYYNSTDRYYLNENNFRMAFSVEGYLDLEIKNSPEYVKWFVRLYGIKDSVEYEKIIPHHKCTEEDYKDFYPVAPKTVPALEKIKSGDFRGLYCIDWTDEDLFVFGEEHNPNYQRLEIVIAPCNYLHQQWGYTKDSISSVCN